MRYGILIAVLAALVVALFALSLLVGPAGIGFQESIAALFAGEGEVTVLVMREIRLPRADGAHRASRPSAGGADRAGRPVGQRRTLPHRHGRLKAAPGNRGGFFYARQGRPYHGFQQGGNPPPTDKTARKT